MVLWKSFLQTQPESYTESYLRRHLDYSGPEPLSRRAAWWMADYGLEAAQVEIIGNEPLFGPPPAWTGQIGRFRTR